MKKRDKKMKLTPINSQSGIVLVIVIWILALLTVMAAELSRTMRTEMTIVRNFKEATQARFIAQAGVNRTILSLIGQRLGPADGRNLRGWGSTPLRINTNHPPVAFANGYYLLDLDNASGWVNLNTAGPALLDLLVERLPIDASAKATIVDAILDWRDRDDFHRLNGAESDYYQSLATPYPCANRDFKSVEELRLVRGISPEIYSHLVSLVIVIPQNPVQTVTDEEDTKAAAAAQRNGSAAGININAAPPQVLAVLPGMTDAQVELIGQYVREAQFTSLDQVRQAIGTETFNAVEPYITLALSPYYLISVEGRINNSRVAQHIEALVRIDATLVDAYRIERLQETAF